MSSRVDLNKLNKCVWHVKGYLINSLILQHIKTNHIVRLVGDHNIVDQSNCFNDILINNILHYCVDNLRLIYNQEYENSVFRCTCSTHYLKFTDGEVVISFKLG